MLINLQSRVIEADFHTYVRPIEHPKIDQFCEEYTGITQNDVNDGLLLAETIRKFHEWLRQLRITKDVRVTDENNCKQNTVFVTWTDFDLGIYLPKECARKHIKLPAYFDKWIDIRDYYSVSTNNLIKNLNFHYCGLLITQMCFNRMSTFLAIRLKCVCGIFSVFSQSMSNLRWVVCNCHGNFRSFFQGSLDA